MLLRPGDEFRFRCHKNIACFNKCCENFSILLAPYDLLRMQWRFGMTAREFIDAYTVDFALGRHSMRGLKPQTRNDSTACIHLAPHGCGVYCDRPAACRYFKTGAAKTRIERLRQHKARFAADKARELADTQDSPYELLGDQ